MMFKTLLKKQLFEVFRTWFYNPKTNKPRSKAGTAGMLLLFLFLMFGVLGGMFTVVAVLLAEPLKSAGAAWLYFDIFALIAVALGLFGSVFNTFSGLYLSKDNDLLLSLPIPLGTVIASRLANVYLMGVLYSAFAFLPAVIVYQVVCGFDGAALLGGIVMMLEISLLVWALSCLLGFAVAKISLRLKNRSFVAVLAALIFIVLYYYVYFKAEAAIRELTVNAAFYGAKIKGSAYLLYLWGQNGEGRPLAILLWLGICLALTAATWFILRKTFLSIATTAPKEKKASAKKKDLKVSSLSRALLKKEFSRFTSSANYMLNCGLGVLFIPAAGIMLLVKGETLTAMLYGLGGFSGWVPIIASAVLFSLASMNDCAAPSVSLEGKSLWVLQSLPLEPRLVIRAKAAVQFLLTAVPMAFFCVCFILAFPVSAAEALLFTALTLLFCLLSALFSVFIGLKMPILDWTNEIVPIKQSGGVAIALFGGWAYALLLVGGYFALNRLAGGADALCYLGAFAVLTAVLAVLLCRWLKTKGAEILRYL